MLKAHSFIDGSLYLFASCVLVCCCTAVLVPSTDMLIKSPSYPVVRAVQEAPFSVWLPLKPSAD